MCTRSHNHSDIGTGLNQESDQKGGLICGNAAGYPQEYVFVSNHSYKKRKKMA